MGQRGELFGPGECGVDVAVDLGEHAVQDEVLESFLAAHVAVERAGDHVEAGGEGAHGQRRDTLLGNEGECLGHHAVPGEGGAPLVGGLGTVKPEHRVGVGVHRSLPSN
jgi:hypothetical protein